jgi:hypothetical protein
MSQHATINPDRWCAINNIVAPVIGDQTTAIEIQLPNTMERPTLLGGTMIKPTTSNFLFLVIFCHNRICGLAVAFKNNFLGGLPALQKKSQN